MKRKKLPKSSKKTINQSRFNLKNKKVAIFIAVGVTLLGLWTFSYISAAPYDGYQRLRIVNMANSQVGNREWNRRVLEYSEGNKENWCADFVSWVYARAGYGFHTPPGPGRSSWRIPIVYKKHSSVPNLRDYLIQRGAYRTKESGYTPGPGDIVIFARHGRSHTGIVEKAANQPSKGGAWIYTIEGNTAENNVGKKAYPINHPTIDGYGTIISKPPPK